MFAAKFSHGQSGFSFLEHSYDLAFGKSAFLQGNFLITDIPRFCKCTATLLGSLRYDVCSPYIWLAQ